MLEDVKKQRSIQKYRRKRSYHGKNKNKAPEESPFLEETNTEEQGEEDMSIEIQHTLNVDIDDNNSEQGANTAPQTTASASKIVDIEERTPLSSSDAISGYRLIDSGFPHTLFARVSWDKLPPVT